MLSSAEELIAETRPHGSRGLPWPRVRHLRPAIRPEERPAETRPRGPQAQRVNLRLAFFWNFL